MATTVTSIGSNQNIDTAVPSTTSGSGPLYDITWNKTLSTSVAIGDLATATDFTSGAYVYLITAISGSTYTLKYISGAGGDQSPADLCDDSYCSTPPTFTFKRAFSTITLFEAMVDDASPSYWGTTDDVVGELHADSNFTDNTVTFNQKQSLSSVTLSVYEDDRHDGTAESGALWKPTSGSGHDVGILRLSIDDMTVEWLDISLDSLDSTNTNKAIVLTGTNNNNIIRNNLIHDKAGNPGGTGPFLVHFIGAGAASDTASFLNNIIYNIVEGSNDNACALLLNQWAGTANIYNNTIYNVQSQGGSKIAIGIRYATPSSSVANVKNNIVAKLTSAASNGERAYEHGANNGGAGTVNEGYNLSDDTSATAYEAGGTGSLIDKTLAEIAFVSTTAGSEDLHIQDSSVCYEAGDDLGTTNEVNIDINGFDRDGGGVTWDMGAHQASRASTGNPAFFMFIDI
jgi:hypothetical protein